MKKITFAFCAFFLGLTALWLLQDPIFAQDNLSFLQARAAFMQYTGIICIVAMALALILAMRPVWLEPYQGGLDDRDTTACSRLP